MVHGSGFLSGESLYFLCQFDCCVILRFMVHGSKICHGSRV